MAKSRLDQTHSAGTDSLPLDLEAEAARQGKTLNVMRYVLGMSLALVILAFIIAYAAIF